VEKKHKASFPTPISVHLRAYFKPVF